MSGMLQSAATMVQSDGHDGRGADLSPVIQKNMTPSILNASNKQKDPDGFSL